MNLTPKRAAMEIYKNWQIRKSDYAPGYYEATNLNDCDAFMKHAKSIEEIKVEIDDEDCFDKTFKTKEK